MLCYHPSNMNDKNQTSNSQNKRVGGIDPAALAAASLAAAVSTLAQTGPFTTLSVVFGITITLIIFAYDVDADRTFSQSIAFGCAAGLPIALGLGYVFQSCEDLLPEFFLNHYLAIVWLEASLIVLFFELFRARRKSAKAAKEAKPSELAVTAVLTVAAVIVVAAVVAAVVLAPSSDPTVKK